MKFNAWTRIVVLASASWIVCVSVVALFEWFHWAPATENSNKTQFFFNYYTEMPIRMGFNPLIKSFDIQFFTEALGWPLGVLWTAYFLVTWGVRWVREGFNQTPT